MTSKLPRPNKRKTSDGHSDLVAGEAVSKIDTSKNPMNYSSTALIIIAAVFVSLPGCHEADGQQKDGEHAEEQHHAEHKILVTSPVAKDVVSTQPYVCQIHSRRHIDVCALEGGYLEEIMVKEGQLVKQGETMFSILPTLYQAKLAAEKAEVQLAQIEYTNTEKLFQQKVVAQPEVALAQAKLAKAQAQMSLAEAELNFATVKAPFDGIIDHQRHQQGSLIAEGDILTTLSDNDVMWAYFNVPEARYLEYQESKDKHELKIELMLANHLKFSQPGVIGAIEADFDNTTGNIAFRGDFPNPDRLLRHGQTGTVLLSRIVKDAIVIPQRATYEILAKKYAYVVEMATEEVAEAAGHDAGHGEEHDADHKNDEDDYDEDKDDDHDKDKEDDHDDDHGKAEHKHANESSQHHVHRGVVRQREIVIEKEQDDIFLIKEGLGVNDRIILEGIQQVRDGDVIEYEFVEPELALLNLKFHAE